MASHADGFLKTRSILGLGVDADFPVQVASETYLRAVARIRDLGGLNGMLVFDRGASYAQYLDQLFQRGSGHTSFDPPRGSEDFDIERYKTIFCDWGWTGPEARRPEWLTS